MPAQYESYKTLTNSRNSGNSAESPARENQSRLSTPSHDEFLPAQLGDRHALKYVEGENNIDFDEAISTWNYNVNLKIYP